MAGLVPAMTKVNVVLARDAVFAVEAAQPGFAFPQDLGLIAAHRHAIGHRAGKAGLARFADGNFRVVWVVVGLVIVCLLYTSDAADE